MTLKQHGAIEEDEKKANDGEFFMDGKEDGRKITFLLENADTWELKKLLS